MQAKLQQKVKQKQRQSLTEQRESAQKEQTEQQDDEKKEDADKNSSKDHQVRKKRKSKVGALCDSDLDNNAAKKKKRKKQLEAMKQRTKDLEESEKDGSKPKPEKTLSPAGYTVLGGFDSKVLQKVHRVLSQWLAEPDVIHRDIKSNLTPISAVSGVCAQLLKKTGK